jgi:hypothetical protein
VQERHVISVASSNIIGIIKRPASIEFSVDISLALALSVRVTSDYGLRRFQNTLPQGHFSPRILVTTGISG